MYTGETKFVIIYCSINLMHMYMYQCHELTYRSNISDKLDSFFTHRPEMNNEELNENKRQLHVQTISWTPL